MKLFTRPSSIGETVLNVEKYTKSNDLMTLDSNVSSSANPHVNLIRAVINNADAKIKSIQTDIAMCEKMMKRLDLELRATLALKETAIPFYKEMESDKSITPTESFN